MSTQTTFLTKLMCHPVMTGNETKDRPQYIHIRISFQDVHPNGVHLRARLAAARHAQDAAPLAAQVPVPALPGLFLECSLHKGRNATHPTRLLPISHSCTIFYLMLLCQNLLPFHRFTN